MESEDCGEIFYRHLSLLCRAIKGCFFWLCLPLGRRQVRSRLGRWCSVSFNSTARRWPSDWLDIWYLTRYLFVRSIVSHCFALFRIFFLCWSKAWTAEVGPELCLISAASLARSFLGERRRERDFRRSAFCKNWRTFEESQRRRAQECTGQTYRFQTESLAHEHLSTFLFE